jgi:Mn2+/Fe2+ NRAMP family transporter
LLLFVSFIFLSLENYGVRKLEAVFAVLIATMAISSAWMFTDTKPNIKDLMIGKDLTYLPSMLQIISCIVVH